MGSRFHNKFHRQNHHTDATAGNPDSASDPIASPSEPFKGDFHVQGQLSGTSLAADSISATEIHATSAYVHYQDILVSETSGFTVNGTETSLTIPSVVVPGVNNVTLNGVGITATNWGTFDGDLETKNNLWVSGDGNFGGTIYVLDGSSTDWNSVYSSVNATSGNWDSVYSSVIENQISAVVGSGTNTINVISSSANVGAFYDLVIYNGLSARASNMMLVWNNAGIEYAESATTDIGDTSTVSLCAVLSGNSAVLQSSIGVGTLTIKGERRLIEI